MSPRPLVLITQRAGRGVWLETSLFDDDPALLNLLDELWHGEMVRCESCAPDNAGYTVWHSKEAHTDEPEPAEGTPAPQ